MDGRKIEVEGVTIGFIDDGGQAFANIKALVDVGPRLAREYFNVVLSAGNMPTLHEACPRCGGELNRTGNVQYCLGKGCYWDTGDEHDFSGDDADAVAEALLSLGALTARETAAGRIEAKQKKAAREAQGDAYKKGTRGNDLYSLGDAESEWKHYRPHWHKARGEVSAREIQRADFILREITGLECMSSKKATVTHWQNNLAELVIEGGGDMDVVRRGIIYGQQSHGGTSPQSFVGAVRRIRANFNARVKTTGVKPVKFRNNAW